MKGRAKKPLQDWTDADLMTVASCSSAAAIFRVLRAMRNTVLQQAVALAQVDRTLKTREDQLDAILELVNEADELALEAENKPGEVPTQDLLRAIYQAQRRQALAVH